ncbi:MAG: hypothetical protein II884_03290 [Synergistaceae bacterium]|nr:hypothetical protein [Synergistaceae bacterium]MBQ3693779.1 hypothetical protein [Synergistaceae bacterium]
MIELKIDKEEVRRAMQLLSGMPGKIQSVIKHALREGGKIISTGISKGVTREYYVKYSAVRKAMRVNISDEDVQITVRDTRHSLKSYMLKPQKAPAKRKSPGYVMGGVKRGSMHKFSRGFILEHNDLPVMRIGKGKYGSFTGLHVLTGPAISQLADNESVMPEVEERTNKRMAQQIRYWTMRELGIMR